MSQVQCPHCGFLNFSISAYCGRCERPLKSPMALTEETRLSPPPVRNVPPRAAPKPLQQEVRRNTPPPAARPPRLDVTAELNNPDTARRLGLTPRRNTSTHDMPTVVSVNPLSRVAQATLIDRDEAADATVIPTAPAPYWRLIAAWCIDLWLGIAVSLAVALSEMLLFDGHWPTDSSGFIDALASWLHLYPATAMRAFFMTLVFFFAYAAWGGRSPGTLGRRSMGLVLLRLAGTPLGWPHALWRAFVGLFSLGLFGAGYFWMVVDGRRRTWHDIVSNSVVVMRRGAG